MIFVEISSFFNDIREQNNGLQKGWFDMFLGALIFIGSMYITYNPAQEASMLISFSLMFYGIYFVVTSLQLSKRK